MGKVLRPTQKIEPGDVAEPAPDTARYYGGLGCMPGQAHWKEMFVIDASADGRCTPNSSRLIHNVSAIPCAAGMFEQHRIGPVCQLLAGTRLTFCGPGYCEGTIKVRAENGLFYFVFAQDLLDSDHTPQTPSEM